MIHLTYTLPRPQLLEKLKIDDVVDASPVHFFCGVWGTIAAGIFASPSNVEMAYGTGSCGLVYSVSYILSVQLTLQNHSFAHNDSHQCLINVNDVYKTDLHLLIT